ncbi:MAG: hypothetical protein FWE19_02920 [Oscillospiraceae bacterium]|nr:hypothetical protein [Oscillospiraceae bacterium]
MHFRKAAAILLAVVVVASLSAPAFAAVGYGDGARPTAPPFVPIPPPWAPPIIIGGGGSGGGGSSGGGGGGGSTNVRTTTPVLPTFVAPAPATPTQVSTATTAAIQQALSAGERASIVLTNVSTAPASVIQGVFTQAAQAGVASAIVHLDTREGGRVLSRMFVDSTTAATLSGTVDFSLRVSGVEVQRAVRIFERSFNNNVVAVSLGQTGAFGANIRMAVLVDLSRLNVDSLVFYAYDREANTFARIDTQFRVDANGYLHFSTPVGGDIIITDRPLTRR